MDFGLSDTTFSQICQVLQRHPQVDKAILYGSRAKGNYKPGSDIDLTLVGDQLSTALLATINDELDELMLPYMIDLSIFSRIKEASLIDHIRRVGVGVYENRGG